MYSAGPFDYAHALHGEVVVLFRFVYVCTGFVLFLAPWGLRAAFFCSRQDLLRFFHCFLEYSPLTEYCCDVLFSAFAFRNKLYIYQNARSFVLHWLNIDFSLLDRKSVV